MENENKPETANAGKTLKPQRKTLQEQSKKTAVVKENLTTEPAAATPEENLEVVSKDRMQAENELFRKFYAALQTEIAELDKTFGKADNQPDPVKDLYGEVSNLKASVEEIKNYLSQLASAGQRQQMQPANQWMPQVQPPGIFQPGAATLPYIPTPNIPPIMPQINNNNNTGRF